MHKLTRMRYSRDEWKEKATKRAEEIREFRKKVSRKELKIAELEAKLIQLEKEVNKKKK
ncbi:hypothetical protein H0A36_09730 [Endozoicomonas sp. SM1973]|uniref:Uncharacterized protein n=1 Tax=Spartinivicinus marinus TaxID=2994442 RepID=A0A853I8T3_9GAMM|nr:hypothetical protein [Spartinivicinus marinus]MCX4024682.1 hypothetical protein [Spartinivicinus marinus]NYZ66291.1 hypothetical protein [Spartinivicinus marinus]